MTDCFLPKLLKSSALAGAFLLAACTGRASEEDWEAHFPVDETALSEAANGKLYSYADMLEPRRAAVVSVTSANIRRRMGNDSQEEMLRRLFGMPPENNRRNSRDTEEQRIPNGLGSGVIISADGYVLTNNHVISNDRGDVADEIMVQLNDRSEVMAEVIGRDERTDVALLKIEAEDLPFIAFGDSEVLRVGDVVFAIGNPLGVGQTVTMGIVSAQGRSNLGLLGNQGYENFIQTDAAINRGNSGGALVDAAGRLVGINSAILSRSGGSIGIGFAIPSNMARDVALDFLTYGEVRRGYLGVSIRDLTADDAELFGLESINGALVENVEDNSPADRADMRRGDVIVSVDGEAVDTVAELRFEVAGVRPGNTVPVEVIRGGDIIMLEVTVGSLDNPLASFFPGENPLEGVELEVVDQEAVDLMNLDEERGVIVSRVEARSPYATVLRPGMVILEVNDQRVDTLGDFAEALRTDRVNKVYIYNRGAYGYIALRIRE